MLASQSSNRVKLFASETRSPRSDHRASNFRGRGRGRGFSLTELLVVIGIIVLLIGLLLVALAAVRKKALRTQTESTMQQFSNACAAFQAEHGQYPGVIPEEFVKFADKPFSSTENALLHLRGGYRVLSPTDPANGQIATDYNQFLSNAGTFGVEITFANPATNQTWRLAVDLKRLGEGPVINGKPYAALFTPGPNEVAVVAGQTDPNGTADDPGIPDLIDGWGQPIIYVRRMRDKGPLLEDMTPNSPRPQFDFEGIKPYTFSWALGELGRNQQLSIIGDMPVGTPQQQNQVCAAIVAHPAFYKSATTNPSGNPLYGNPRGSFMLLSAGPDGVYFSRTDGIGSESGPIGGSGPPIDDLINAGPRAVDEFDDVRVYGGG